LLGDTNDGMPATIPIARPSASFFASADSVHRFDACLFLSLLKPAPASTRPLIMSGRSSAKVDRDHRSERDTTQRGV
jgi:hypothetical protein